MYSVEAKCKNQFPIREEYREGYLERPSEILSLRRTTQWKEFLSIDLGLSQYDIDNLYRSFCIIQIIQPLGIKFPPFYSTKGSFGKLNFTTFVLQSIQDKKECNKSVSNITSR